MGETGLEREEEGRKRLSGAAEHRKKEWENGRMGEGENGRGGEWERGRMGEGPK